MKLFSNEKKNRQKTNFNGSFMTKQVNRQTDVFFSNVASCEPWLDLTISPWPTQRLILKLIYLDRGDQFKT